MQVYKGINALSAFRKEKLLKQLQGVESSITDIQAEYVHFVDAKEVFAASDETSLQELLTYGTPFESLRAGNLILVTPRPGSISPWLRMFQNARQWSDGQASSS